MESIDVFRPINAAPRVIASERFRAAVEDRRLSGLEFVPIEISTQDTPPG